MNLLASMISALGLGTRRAARSEPGSAEFRRRHAALEKTLHRSGLGAFERAIREWLSVSGAAGAAVYDEHGVPCALAKSGGLEPAGLSDPARLWSLLRRETGSEAFKVTRQPGLTVVAGWVELAGASWHLVTWHAV